MKYNILINQKAVVDYGLRLDIVDVAIFDLLKDFSLSSRCKRMAVDDKVYFLFNWKLVSDQLPILGLNTRQSVFKRFMKLKEEKIIEAHPDNTTLGQSWYRFGERHSFLIFTPDNESLQPVTENELTVNESLLKPDNNGIHNNTPFNNTIKDKGGASPPAPNPDDLKKKEQLDVRNRKISFLKLIIDYCSENMHKYPKLMYVDFAKYWVEQSLNKKKLKLRFEQEEFFDIGRRLSTWFKGCKDAQLSGYWESETKVGTLNDLFKKQILGIHGNGQGQ